METLEQGMESAQSQKTPEWHMDTCIYYWLRTDPTPFPSVSIIDFEKVNVYWKEAVEQRCSVNGDYSLDSLTTLPLLFSFVFLSFLSLPLLFSIFS